jgi:hypothetical protein
MACSKAKLKSNGDKASPCFRPFCIRNVSDHEIILYIKFLAGPQSRVAKNIQSPIGGC